MSKSAKSNRHSTLEIPDNVDIYLNEAFFSNDPKQITKALGVVARTQGMLDVAKKTGLAREHLYNSLGENGNPTLHTLITVLDALGYRLKIEPK